MHPSSQVASRAAHPSYALRLFRLKKKNYYQPRTFAAMKDYQLDGNKEMVTLGAMNIVGSMTSCYVATGEKKTQTSSWQSI